ncbi:hypothetical protein Taro_020898, partial [Colocasia esculenta]|nr:hypothetical protein [Colocasia esculenta]
MLSTVRFVTGKQDIIKDWNKVSAGNKVLAVPVDSQDVPIDRYGFPRSKNAILTVPVNSQGVPVDSHCQ